MYCCSSFGNDCSIVKRESESDDERENKNG